jgi:hypothetical protein
MTPTDRFQMPRVMREFLNVAIKTRTVDAASVWALALNHGSDFTAMRNEIMDYAFADRHTSGKHSEMCKINDECHRVMVMGLDATILFD